MEIFGYEFGKVKAQKKSTSSVIVPSGSFLEFALLGGNITATKSMKFYRTNSSVATAVDMIAESFQQIKPVLQGPDGKLDKDHPVIKLLNQPNGLQAWESYVGQLSRHYLLTANTHTSGLGGVRRPPLELYAVKPQHVQPTEDNRDLFPATYRVVVGAGRGFYTRKEKFGEGIKFYDGTLKQLFHIMGFSSNNSNVSGDSPLQAISQDIKQQISGRTHNLKMIQNGGRLSLIVSFKDPDGMEPDEHKERKKRIREDLSGENNAGGIAVISAADTTINEVGKSNKDMDYAKLDTIASNIIFLRYKIPLPLVTNDAATFNNMQTAIGLLFSQAVLPHAKTVFGGLSKFLLPRYGLDPSEWQITFDPLSIPAIKAATLDDIAKRKTINIETTNELRAEMGKEPISEGADKLYQAANLVEVGTDLFTDDQLTGEEED